MLLWVLLSAFFRVLGVFCELFNAKGLWHSDANDERERLRAKLERDLDTAGTYEEWRATARKLDELNGFGEWREQSTEYFDAELARQRLDTLKSLHASDDVWELMHHIRVDLHRGNGGIWNAKMHVYHTGSKRLIEEYLEYVEQMLSFIVDHPKIPSKDKYTFFTDISATYGYSALVLSGAAALGIYHIGVIVALHTQKLLPGIISGTNTGSIVAAIVCTHHEDELLKMVDFESDECCIRFEIFASRDKDQTGNTLTRRLRRFMDQGVLLDIHLLKDFLRSTIGDMTFMEAYNKTGRVLNIVCSQYPEKGRGRKTYWAMNYLTAPHVTIWSAACASCAVPGIYEQVTLVAKSSTGELEDYYPAVPKWGQTGNATANERVAWERLSELFNINYFILSETNINVIPSISTRYEGFFNTMWTVFREEVAHRLNQMVRLGIFSSNAEVIASLFTRPFEGDVEIFPAWSLTDFLKLLTNPNKKMAGRCAHIGQKRTWPKLNTIRLLCSIERTLERCTKAAKMALIAENPDHLAFYREALSPEVLNTL
eukprot:EG_transcript_2880